MTPFDELAREEWKKVVPKGLVRITRKLSFTDCRVADKIIAAFAASLAQAVAEATREHVQSDHLAVCPLVPDCQSAIASRAARIMEKKEANA